MKMDAGFKCRMLAMTAAVAVLAGGSVHALEIDPAAPARAAAEIRIKAPLEVVWSVETGIDEWPKWNPGVSRAALSGPLQAGSTFEWKSGGSAISSTLQVVEPMKQIGWTGRTMGIRAVHVWTFERSDGEVVVRTEESFSGFLVRLFPGTFKSMLAAALEKNIGALKTESEKRARP